MSTCVCVQRSPCRHQETFHERADRVGCVSSLRVGVEGVCWRPGEFIPEDVESCTWPHVDVRVYVCQAAPSLLALMGLRVEGLVPAVVLPLLLTMVPTTTIIRPPSVTIATCRRDAV